MPKTKFAIVGIGHIGQRHLDLLQANPKAEVIACVDIDPSKKERCHQVPFFSSIDDLMKQNITPDVVSICTPNGLHHSQSLQFLKKGINVICEKPMCMSKTQAQEMKELAEAHQAHVFCVMQNRYSPASVWLKELVESQILGEIYAVTMTCIWNRDERYYENHPWKGSLDMDGGPLFTQFSHFVDMLLWTFGQVDEQSIHPNFYKFRNNHLTQFEDSGRVDFKFKSQAKGHIFYSTSAYDKNVESSIQIIAEKGTVKVGGQYMDKVDYCHINNYKAPQLSPANPPNNYGSYQGSAANHQFIFDNVFDVLEGKSEIDISVHDGINLVSFIENIYLQRDSKKFNSIPLNH